MNAAEIRLAKWNWARNHPDKVKYANANWRAANADKVRRQARDRMKRFRARKARDPASLVTLS